MAAGIMDGIVIGNIEALLTSLWPPLWRGFLWAIVILLIRRAACPVVLCPPAIAAPRTDADAPQSSDLQGDGYTRRRMSLSYAKSATFHKPLIAADENQQKKKAHPFLGWA
jgi:hypothetical protein